MVFYNMLITSLPEDQRPAEDDFGPSLRANDDDNSGVTRLRTMTSSCV
jgi:hypothetical protein